MIIEDIDDNITRFQAYLKDNNQNQLLFSLNIIILITIISEWIYLIYKPQTVSLTVIILNLILLTSSIVVPICSIITLKLLHRKKVHYVIFIIISSVLSIILSANILLLLHSAIITDTDDFLYPIINVIMFATIFCGLTSLYYWWNWREEISKYYGHHWDNLHTAIIIAVDKSRLFSYAGYNGPYLAKKLRIIHEPYRIYFCENKDDFCAVLREPLVTRLVIFGHGSRGSLYFGDGDCIYEDIVESNRDIKKRDHIHQFHSNYTSKNILDKILGRTCAKKSLCELLLEEEKDSGNATDYGYILESGDSASNEGQIKTTLIRMLRRFNLIHNDGTRSLHMNRKRIDEYISYLKQDSIYWIQCRGAQFYHHTQQTSIFKILLYLIPVIFILIPMIGVFLLYQFYPGADITINTWIGAIGGYFGGAVGGTATLCALYITYTQNEKFKNEKQEEREEEYQQSISPYIDLHYDDMPSDEMSVPGYCLIRKPNTPPILCIVNNPNFTTYFPSYYHHKIVLRNLGNNSTNNVIVYINSQLIQSTISLMKGETTEYHILNHKDYADDRLTIKVFYNNINQSVVKQEFLIRNVMLVDGKRRYMKISAIQPMQVRSKKDIK